MTGERFKDGNHNTTNDYHYHVTNFDGSEDIVFEKDNFSMTDKKKLSNAELQTKIEKRKSLDKAAIL